MRSYGQGFHQGPFAWSEDEFLQRTEGSAIRRSGHARWLRNIAVALGNAATSPEVVAALRSRRELSLHQQMLQTEWLLDAGASCTGITICDEFFYSVLGTNVHYGAPVNIHALRHVTGHPQQLGSRVRLVERDQVGDRRRKGVVCSHVQLHPACEPPMRLLSMSSWYPLAR